MKPVLKSSAEGEARVFEALAGCQNFDDVERLGVLFHGSVEKIEGDLRGGGYDDVFWTAKSPAIAQAYIPTAGVSNWVSKPSGWRLDDSLRPSVNGGAITEWALARANVTLEDLDIETDGWQVTGWRNPEGWPTNRDMVAWIENELGYVANENDVWEISCDHEDGRDVFRPADWSREGLLIIAVPRDLRIEPARWSEEGMGYSAHNRVADFARMEAEGMQAFEMSDLLQSKHWGNVGHKAVGLFPAGLKEIDWIAIPARRHDGPDVKWGVDRETAEFVDFMKEVAPAYAPETEPVSGMSL
jgi:hypothetical protein